MPAISDYARMEKKVGQHMQTGQPLPEHGDLYVSFAMKLFNVTAEQVTADMRRAAKSQVFSILYTPDHFTPTKYE